MINITDPHSCCGCTACASICTHNAITMRPDVLGFLYPVVDIEQCVNCGLCDDICAFNEKYDKSYNLPKPIAYGARHNDINEVASSRSGAAFIAISDYILSTGGVVYGVGYSENFRVVHKRAETKEQRNEFKGSKYVQSDLSGVFKFVKQDLRAGLTVLFSGTPCQTAGLHSFVGNKLRDNLILIDIVCHGVPSPYIWRDYLIYLEKKYSSKICKVNFRDKDKFGWTAHQESFKFVSGIEKIPYTYTYAFYKHIIFRHSCEVCKYTNLQRPSDITIADFWGWEKTNTKINADDKGISLVLCNTAKGQELFDIIKGCMTIIPVELSKCMQPNMQHPTIMHSQRINFERDYANRGFEYVMKKYGNLGVRYQINKYILYIKKML